MSSLPIDIHSYHVDKKALPVIINMPANKNFLCTISFNTMNTNSVQLESNSQLMLLLKTFMMEYIPLPHS